MLRKLLFIAPFALIVPDADAQCPNGRCPAPEQYAVRYVRAPGAVPASYAPADPQSFGSWLNAVRAQYGRSPLAFDAALQRNAAINSSRGFGHSWFGGATRQNVGMGSLQAVQSMWLASPAHVAALLDPGITKYGLACVNGVWTYSAR